MAYTPFGRGAEVPGTLRAKAELERRRRNRVAQGAERLTAVVVIPPMDPPPTPPADDALVAGPARIESRAEQSARLRALMGEYFGGTLTP